MTTTRGVKKVSENILTNGRAIIVTEKDKDKYKWDEIPVGSKFIDTKTGIEQVKLEGQSDWVPAGIKNDGTLCIAKDTRLIEENFELVSLNNDDGTFTYNIIKTDGTKVKRQMPKTSDGAYVFELENGTYKRERHHLEVLVDNILHYDEKDGLTELSEKRFSLKENLAVGHIVTARYVVLARFGAPYPRVYTNINAKLGETKMADNSKNTPVGAEEGDFWLDEGYTEPPIQTLPWENITGRPTTLAGYGIPDNFSRIGHLHHLADIVDMPESFPANGGNADTVSGKKPGSSAGNLVCLDENGYIPTNYISSDIVTELGILCVQTTAPSGVKEGTIWFDITDGKECIRVLKNGSWCIFGAAWQS